MRGGQARWSPRQLQDVPLYMIECVQDYVTSQMSYLMCASANYSCYERLKREKKVHVEDFLMEAVREMPSLVKLKLKSESTMLHNAISLGINNLPKVLWQRCWLNAKTQTESPQFSLLKIRTRLICCFAKGPIFNIETVKINLLQFMFEIGKELGMHLLKQMQPSVIREELHHDSKNNCWPLTEILADESQEALVDLTFVSSS